MARPLWDAVEPALRADIQRLAGGQVVDARSCPGGFSPGFASRLTLADGGRVFVKAIDARRWPHEVDAYRAEARVNAALPASAPAPRFLGALDDERWTVLAFEDVDGTNPDPWTPDALDRVLAAIADLGRPSADLDRDHPRLGGWATLTAGRLAPHDPWAAANLPALTALERAGLDAARGDSLVHCDLYPHNILLAPDRVVVVDWPHARLGAPVVDLVTALTSAAADGLDPEPALRRHAAHVLPSDVDAVLAAHAGFLVAGGLVTMPPGLEPIAAAKRRLGAAAVGWLRHRIDGGESPIED
jgi:aminoglycoside phosphotransferase (APT) family kinase protein